MNKTIFLQEPRSYLYKDNTKKSEIVSEILYGDKLKIIQRKGKWIKIRNLYDGYIGYINKTLSESYFKPSHKINVLKASIYIKKKSNYIKTKKFLSFASKIMILKKEKKFINFHKKYWIKTKDLIKINHTKKSLSKIAKLFLNIRYKWGGVNFTGIDCSALIQIIYKYNNKFCPRDSKDQINFFTRKRNKRNFSKNDLIFWKGHVALCLNSKFLIHAYGPKKKVIIMEIKKTITEIEKKAKLKIISTNIMSRIT